MKTGGGNDPFAPAVSATSKIAAVITSGKHTGAPAQG